MSGLLCLAWCRAFSPGTVNRGGSGPSPARGTPSLALILSGGIHLLVLALVMGLVARTQIVEPPTVELRPWPKRGPSLIPPPEIRSPAPTVPSAPTDNGIIDPVDDVRLAPTVDPFTEGPVEGVDRGTTSVEREGHPGGTSAPTDGGNLVVNPDLPTDTYDQPPSPIVAPEPPYPELPREAGIEGRVVLEALVTWEGRVRDVRIKEGNRMLAEPAAKVVKTWRFRPARWRGQPVTVWVSIPIVFKLH